MKHFKRETGLWLQIWFVCALIVPNVAIIAVTRPATWLAFIQLALPSGFFMIWGAVLSRSGIMILLSVPLMFLAAFQLVLLYLFEDTVISSDMFSNLMTTSVSESAELLGNIYPVIIVIVLGYLSLIVAAVYSLIRKRRLSERVRYVSVLSGAMLMCLGAIVAISLKIKGCADFDLVSDVFPSNVIYNHMQSRKQWARVRSYDDLSSGFDFMAVRNSEPECREIYVMVVGESSRAFSWGAYGYGRNTTPRLDTTRGVCRFSRMITQSNATYKSVPMMLCCVNAATYNYICGVRSILELFSSAGFRTAFISNQSPDGAMIDNFASQSDTTVYLGCDGALHMDDELPHAMREIIKEDDGDLFMVLHTYGSHFNYNNRYPESFAHFKPDRISYLNCDNAEQVVNAYDNSILYTDYVLSLIISELSATDACTALMYCSDHGEDLFDDTRSEFLHSSSHISYYQLHVPCFCWMSEMYVSHFPEKFYSACRNGRHTASTASVFHTLSDIADIESPYVHERYSLVSENYDTAAAKYYLDDRLRPVKYRQCGINDDDLQIFLNKGIVFSF